MKSRPVKWPYRELLLTEADAKATAFIGEPFAKYLIVHDQPPRPDDGTEECGPCLAARSWCVLFPLDLNTYLHQHTLRFGAPGHCTGTSSKLGTNTGSGMGGPCRIRFLKLLWWDQRPVFQPP